MCARMARAHRILRARISGDARAYARVRLQKCDGCIQPIRGACSLARFFSLRIGRALVGLAPRPGLARCLVARHSHARVALPSGAPTHLPGALLAQPFA